MSICENFGGEIFPVIMAVIFDKIYRKHTLLAGLPIKRIFITFVSEIMAKNNKNNTTTRNNPLKWTYAGGALMALLIVMSIALWQFSSVGYRGETSWVHIPAGATSEAVGDSLRNALGNDFGPRVYRLWRWMDGKPAIAHGAYRIDRSTAAWKVARTLKNGAQTPVKLTFNNIRTLPDLASRLSSKMEWSAEDFINACDTILPKHGFTPPQFTAAFLPDTYEFYWNTPANKVVTKLLGYRNDYWDSDRRAIARDIGLSPVEVATIASIVEEETLKADERPKVARLYINRLERGMKLQADPTVKFAVGDFSLRRIKGTHLAVKSPYNTYLNYGLPPGPIRIAGKDAIEAVLSAPHHNYIYMCAKEDFSGYHNFAVDYATHRANARRYHEMLNQRKIN